MLTFLKEFFTQSKLYKEYSLTHAFVAGGATVLIITVYGGEFKWWILGGLIFLDLIINYALLKNYMWPEKTMDKKINFDRKAHFWTLIGFNLGWIFMLLMIG